jgi:hypothetical protein
MDELLGESAPRARAKCGPAPAWQQLIEQIAKTPRAQQWFVSKMLQNGLAQS